MGWWRAVGLWAQPGAAGAGITPARGLPRARGATAGATWVCHTRTETRPAAAGAQALQAEGHPLHPQQTQRVAAFRSLLQPFSSLIAGRSKAQPQQILEAGNLLHSPRRRQHTHRTATRPRTGPCTSRPESVLKASSTLPPCTSPSTPESRPRASAHRFAGRSTPTPAPSAARWPPLTCTPPATCGHAYVCAQTLQIPCTV
ncbi:MAG: hypothetical protein J3K34DRAFT_438685 [Monoraphidium minutum]|nr:MAG: hypothetical protein J3K34DRAFT_438685 [Monoraphidium minutum]